MFDSEGGRGAELLRPLSRLNTMARRTITDRWTVVDMFCGVGGLAHGFVKEGFRLAAGIDIDESCEYPFEHNNGAPFIRRDVQSLTSSELAALFGNSRRRILIGCAPCQPFSKYTSAQTEDSKWHLLRSFLKLIIQVLPEVISMENVAELQKHVIFHDFVEALEEHGYEVTESVVDTWRYGVPQTRKRLVLLASRLGRICLPPPTHSESRQRTVRSVIGNLEKISAGETSPNDPLHQARALSGLNLKRIRSTPEGGDWREWPTSLRLKCHKRASGKRCGPLELLIQRQLRGKGLSFQRNCKGLDGSPDIVFPKQKVAIFIDGDFWHGWRFPAWEQKLSEFWKSKLHANRRRDQRNFRRLRAADWTVIRLWEHEIRADSDRCVNRILRAL